MRLVWIAIGLAALTACYDFSGDLDRIGFDSNLVVDGGRPWTPEYGIANASRVEFEAVDIVGDDDDRKPDVTGTVSGRAVQAFVDGRNLGLSGSDVRAVVRFQGELVDHFKVAFRAPDQAELVDVVAAALDHDAIALPEVFGLLEGSTREVGVSLHDRRGRSLGYVPADLVLGGEGSVSAWFEDGAYRLVAEAPGTAAIGVDHAGTWISTSRIHVVSADEVVSLHLEGLVREPDGDRLTRGAVWAEGRTADGLPVYGIPVDWTVPALFDGDFDVEGDTLTLSEDDLPAGVVVTARWGDMQATYAL